MSSFEIRVFVIGDYQVGKNSIVKRFKKLNSTQTEEDHYFIQGDPKNEYGLGKEKSKKALEKFAKYQQLETADKSLVRKQIERKTLMQFKKMFIVGHTRLEFNFFPIKSAEEKIVTGVTENKEDSEEIYIYEKDVDGFGSEEFSCISIYEGHKGDIKMVKFCPNNNVLFSCGFDESFKIWEQDITKDDFVLINTIKEHSGTVWCIEFNKKGDMFFTCSDDMNLIMWKIGIANNINSDENNLNTETIFDYENIVKLAKIINLHSRPIYSCSLYYNENYIFSCSNDGNIGIIKIIKNKDEDGNDKYELKLINMIKDAHEKFSVNCICSNKNEIISCGDDCNIKIWKFEEKE